MNTRLRPTKGVSWAMRRERVTSTAEMVRRPPLGEVEGRRPGQEQEGGDASPRGPAAKKQKRNVIEPYLTPGQQ